MTTVRLVMSPAGDVSGIYQDLPGLVAYMEALGPASIRRASHVEPTPGNRWTADMAPSGGPVLGPFNQRQEALAAEVQWLRGHMEGAS